MRCFSLSVAIVVLIVRPAVGDEPKSSDGYKPLFNGTSLAGWHNANCAPSTFFVKDGQIVTTGTPTGFLRTDRQYENFELELDWMHVEKTKTANSGLFVWGDPLPAVGTPYTRGIEVQVLINYPKVDWATNHGDIFSIHGAKCKPDRPHPRGYERCLPSENRVKGGGEWNHYKVIANNGAIKLHVNGKEVSGVSQCNPRKGYLALESEGAECHFKNIRIKELPSTNPKPEECAKVWEGHESLFDGLDLKGWSTEKDSWKVSGGKLIAKGTESLKSEKKFSPCELMIDWRMPVKSSGDVTINVAGVGCSVFPGAGVAFTPDWEPTAKGKDPFAKKGVWNRSVILFDGKKFIFNVNGVQVAMLEAKKPIKANTVWIANHFNDSNERLEVMNLFIRELKAAK
ncbi:MAG TPA: family 16 glycoside hydrolase [Urbifossiella sp.]|nr:family 16 glycoside hydrolase [Urbifossiella sp.]